MVRRWMSVTGVRNLFLVRDDDATDLVSVLPDLKEAFNDSETVSLYYCATVIVNLKTFHFIYFRSPFCYTRTIGLQDQDDDGLRAVLSVPVVVY